jgi:hypothetical protein
MAEGSPSDDFTLLEAGSRELEAAIDFRFFFAYLIAS